MSLNSVNSSKTLCIGKIIKPQGIKGEVKLLPETNVPAVFNGLKSVIIDNKVYFVIKSDFRFGFAYLLLDGIDNRNKSELLRNKMVFVSKDVFNNLDAGTYLVVDLIGCNIYDENDMQLGQIEDVENYGSADILIVAMNGRRYQIPFISEIFIDVNIKSKIVKVSTKALNENKISC